MSALEASAGFRDWFAGSRITTQEGAPLRVYHGTYKSFDRFDTGGAYFSACADYASVHAEIAAEAYEGAALVIPCFLALRNPAIASVDLLESVGYDSGIIDRLEADGHDGVMTEDGVEIFVFDVRRAKSAIGNCGRFDPGSASMID